mmetsp:Transcript_20294/g.46110  ORF Transcript_20294/g.46110 Transcript_20294/m.46110 type:complete len:89 (-) Transcript_20294:17-283(-)
MSGGLNKEPSLPWPPAVLKLVVSAQDLGYVQLFEMRKKQGKRKEGEGSASRGLMPLQEGEGERKGRRGGYGLEDETNSSGPRCLHGGR